MTPSAKELAAGQRACERLEAFQQCRDPFGFSVLVFLVAGFGICSAFERGGWKEALGVGVFWFALMAISFYQFQKQKKQTAEDSVFLADLKTKYGDDVYSMIEKTPHSLLYNIFQRRLPPFSRRFMKLP